ncbi:hypothetical protein WJX72_001314 [[Myrmecia] bisecta]|uniref:U3 small nucleolar RNA-associated protein 11 n=1 Tax=[Myrmecia] bisecta TaxID=41462 RepID=A0AAW1PKA8_9CHLO
MSSTLRNAVKRKTHKERAQPAARRQYGLLEKKKDYLLRAKDYHKKEKTIQTLKRKAEERNPDEFYFAMEKQRTRDGIHDGRLTEANKYSPDELRLMKTQDAGYLGMKAQTEAKKIERLKASLHYIGVPAQNKHIVFVDSDREARKFNPEKHFDTPAELLTRSFNRPRTAQLDDPEAAPSTSGAGSREAGNLEKRRGAAYRDLLQRTQRQQKLQRLAGKMVMDKQVMGKGRKRKLKPSEVEGDVSGPVFKWRRERKK